MKTTKFSGVCALLRSHRTVVDRGDRKLVTCHRQLQQLQQCRVQRRPSVSGRLMSAEPTVQQGGTPAAAADDKLLITLSILRLL